MYQSAEPTLTSTRRFNPPDGVSLQHMAPVQCRTTVLEAVRQGRFNTTWQTILLRVTKNQGISTGLVTIPYPAVANRPYGRMTVGALEYWEALLVNRHPEMEPWHRAVLGDMHVKLPENNMVWVLHNDKDQVKPKPKT